METGIRTDDDQEPGRGGGHAGRSALVPSGAWYPQIHEGENGDGNGEARAGWVDDAPRILLAGVDSLNFSFDVEVSEEIYLALMGEQLQARLAQRARNAAYCSRWLDARVAAVGGEGLRRAHRDGGLDDQGAARQPDPPATLHRAARPRAAHPSARGARGLRGRLCLHPRQAPRRSAGRGTRPG